jgi:hypothetical protein
LRAQLVVVLTPYIYSNFDTMFTSEAPQISPTEAQAPPDETKAAFEELQTGKGAATEGIK